jgi:hypothetical protein
MFTNTWEHLVRPLFVFRFDCNHSRAPIHAPSCCSMRLKWSGTEITSKNAKISTLDPYNFFLAGFCYTILYETYLIPIYSIYWKFAPILRSQNKSIFYESGLLSPFPPLLQPACFTCLFRSLCGLCSLRLYGGVGLKGRVCVPVRHTQSLSPQHRTRTQSTRTC